MHKENSRKIKNENPFDFFNLLIEKTIEGIQNSIEMIINFVDDVFTSGSSYHKDNFSKYNPAIQIIKAEKELEKMTSNLLQDFIHNEITKNNKGKANDVLNFYTLNDSQKKQKFKQFIEDKNDDELKILDQQYSLADRILNLFNEEKKI